MRGSSRRRGTGGSHGPEKPERTFYDWVWTLRQRPRMALVKLGQWAPEYEVECPDFVLVLPRKHFQLNKALVTEFWQFYYQDKSLTDGLKQSLKILNVEDMRSMSSFPGSFVYHPKHANNTTPQETEGVGLFRRNPLPGCRVYFKLFASAHSLDVQLRRSLQAGYVRKLLRRLEDLWVYRLPDLIHVLRDKAFVKSKRAVIKHWRNERENGLLMVCSKSSAMTPKFRSKFVIDCEGSGGPRPGLFKRIPITGVRDYVQVEQFRQRHLEAEAAHFMKFCEGIGALSCYQGQGFAQSEEEEGGLSVGASDATGQGSIERSTTNVFFGANEVTNIPDPQCLPMPFSPAQVCVGTKHFGQLRDDYALLCGIMPIKTPVLGGTIGFEVKSWQAGRLSAGAGLTLTGVGLLKIGLRYLTTCSSYGSSRFFVRFKDTPRIAEINNKPMRKAPGDLHRLIALARTLGTRSMESREDTTNSLRFIVTGSSQSGKSSFVASVESAMHGYYFHDRRTSIASWDPRLINTVHPRLRLNRRGNRGTYEPFALALPLPLPYPDDEVSAMRMVDTVQIDLDRASEEDLRQAMVEWTRASELNYINNYIFLLIDGVELIRDYKHSRTLVVEENVQFLEILAKQFQNNKCPLVSILISKEDELKLDLALTSQERKDVVKHVRKALKEKDLSRCVKHIRFVTNRTFDEAQLEEWQQRFNQRPTDSSDPVYAEWEERNSEILQPLLQALDTIIEDT